MHFTWLTPPKPYRATTCRETELTMDHIHTFLITQGLGGPPRMSDQFNAGATSETAQTWKTIHTRHSIIPTRRIWNDDNGGQIIFGDLVGLKFPDIRLTGEEKPRKKNLTQKTCPDRESSPGPLRDKRAWYCLLLLIIFYYLLCS